VKVKEYNAPEIKSAREWNELLKAHPVTSAEEQLMFIRSVQADALLYAAERARLMPELAGWMRAWHGGQRDACRQIEHILLLRVAVMNKEQ
jgi:hypothetical protein